MHSNSPSRKGALIAALLLAVAVIPTVVWILSYRSGVPHEDNVSAYLSRFPQFLQNTQRLTLTSLGLSLFVVVVSVIGMSKRRMGPLWLMALVFAVGLLHALWLAFTMM